MRKRNLMMPLAGLAITAGALLSAGITAGPASAATGTGCPATKTGVPVASNVSASVSTTGSTSSYTFTSLADEHPISGVPGLVNYCVYPTSPTADPASHTVAAHGDNTAKWVYAAGGSNNFAFSRPGGNPSNIGLDKTSTPMGTATWNTVPDKQAIVLHINDSAMCASLYGAGTSATCFVRPSPPAPPGPVCDNGDSNVAYNAMPTNVADCINPAQGFESDSIIEMGDSVALKAGTGRTLDTFKVDLQSFGCGTSGHWYSATDPCVTASGDTFTHPITANIYDPNGSGGLTTPIATDTENQTIKFRPSADPTCPAVGSSTTPSVAWRNPASGNCQNSIGNVLSFSNFTAPGGGSVASLPENVVWTIAFNTTDYGTPPVGLSSCSATDAGCGYDSLNLGDATHANAPYAGSALNADQVLINKGAGLQVDTGWTNYRPLGEIITAP